MEKEDAAEDEPPVKDKKTQPLVWVLAGAVVVVAVLAALFAR
jgi:hypothetical protein